MKKLFYGGLIVLVSISFSCKDDDEKEKAKSKSDILAGDPKRSWKITSATGEPVDEDESCKLSSARSQDNRYIFFKGGYFEFNRGTITNDECDDEFCCSDAINLYGSWKFTDGETILDVTAEGELLSNGTKVPFDPEEFMVAPIQTLTETKMILQDAGIAATFVPAD